jgi:hypothetical protein
MTQVRQVPRSAVAPCYSTPRFFVNQEKTPCIDIYNRTGNGRECRVRRCGSSTEASVVFLVDMNTVRGRGESGKNVFEFTFVALQERNHFILLHIAGFCSCGARRAANSGYADVVAAGEFV